MSRKEELRQMRLERRRNMITETFDLFHDEAQQLSLLSEEDRGNKGYNFSSRCNEFRTELEKFLELEYINKKEFRSFSNTLSRCAILAGLSIHHKKENETEFSIFRTVEEFDAYCETLKRSA